MIKAILIDPYAGTVTEVDHDPDGANFDGTYKLLSGAPHDVDIVERVFLPNGDMIWLDENAKIRAIDGLRCFKIDGYPELLAGRGLLVGDGGQRDATPHTTLEQARAAVTFDRDAGAEPTPTYGDEVASGQTTPERRKEARQALLELATIADDDEFDKAGAIFALGVEMDSVLHGVEGARAIARKLKLDERGVGAQSAISHCGHEYHVTVRPCLDCEQHAKAEAGTAEPAPTPKAE